MFRENFAKFKGNFAKHELNNFAKILKQNFRCHPIWESISLDVNVRKKIFDTLAPALFDDLAAVKWWNPLFRLRQKIEPCTPSWAWSIPSWGRLAGRRAAFPFPVRLLFSSLPVWLLVLSSVRLLILSFPIRFLIGIVSDYSVKYYHFRDKVIIIISDTNIYIISAACRSNTLAASAERRLYSWNS